MFQQVSYSQHDVGIFTNVVRNVMILLNLVTLCSPISLNQLLIRIIFYLDNISSNYPICSLHIYSALVKVLHVTYSSIMFLFQSVVTIAHTCILP